MKVLAIIIMMIFLAGCGENRSYEWIMSDQYVFDFKSTRRDIDRKQVALAVDAEMNKYYSDWKSGALWCDWANESNGSINVSIEIPMMIYRDGKSTMSDYYRNRALVREAVIRLFSE